MNYDSDVSHAKVVCSILAVALVVFGVIGLVINHYESKKASMNNQCIEAGGTPLVVGGEIKCFSELKVIPLRK